MNLPYAQPLLLLALLIGQSLVAWAVAAALGLAEASNDGWRRLLLHALACALLTVLISAIAVIPLDALLQTPSMNSALVLSAALLLVLLALWRTWPWFALSRIGPPATSRAPELWRQTLDLGRDAETFFTHGLLSAVALLLATASSLIVVFRPHLLPTDNRILAALILLAVVFPITQLIVLSRGRHLLDLTAQSRRQRERRDEAHDGPSLRRLPSGLRKAELDASLLAALKGGDGALALEALERGADPNVSPAANARDQRQALVLAVALPDLKPLRALIAAGADVNACSGGLTALLAATRDSYEGRPEVVLTLIANGADTRICDAEGNSPLHYAARCVEPIVAAQLIDAGADLDASNHDGHTALGIACANANSVMANYLLERGANPLTSNAEPALRLAASIADDDPGLVKLLLKRKADPNAVGSLNRTALIDAALAGNQRIAEALLVAGADPDLADSHGTTALMEASRSGAVAIVNALTKRKSTHIDAVDHGGRSALLIACTSRQASEDCVRALLAAGADRERVDEGGRRAVDHAAAAGRWHIVALLDPSYSLPSSVSTAVDTMEAASAEHLADALRFGHWRVAAAFAGMIGDWPQAVLGGVLIRLVDSEQRAARDWLFNRGLQANAQMDDQRPLADHLIQALPASEIALRHVIERGAAINGCGLVARILTAAPRGISGASLRALAADLVDSGADIGGRWAGQHALHLAIFHADGELLVRLLQRGADPNVRDALGRTPLHASLALDNSQSLPLLQHLLRAGARPEIASANGETALGLALAHGHRELAHWLSWTRWPLPGRPLRDSDLPSAASSNDAAAVERLIAIGLPIDAADSYGATALIRASGCGDARAVALLLDAGADPTRCASSGASCLTAAVSARRETVVGLLLDRGIDPNHALPGGATALHVAAALGLPRIATLLLAAGARVDVCDIEGTTPLHAAALFAFRSRDTAAAAAMFEHLLRNGATPSQKDGQHCDSLMLLLGARADPSTPCDAQSLSLLTGQLLDHGAALDQQDLRGVSALHACAMHGLLGCARQLKARGAPLDLVDSFGRSAGEVAGRLGFADLATELGANRHAVPGVHQMLRKRTTD